MLQMTWFLVCVCVCVNVFVFVGSVWSVWLCLCVVESLCGCVLVSLDVVSVCVCGFPFWGIGKMKAHENEINRVRGFAFGVPASLCKVFVSFFSRIHGFAFGVPASLHRVLIQ